MCDKTTHLSCNCVLVCLAEGYRAPGMAVRASRDPRTVYDKHLCIVDAINRNMPKDAERLACRHVLEARRFIEQGAARNAFIPTWVVNAAAN